MSSHHTLFALSLACVPLFAGCLGSDVSEAPEAMDATEETADDISFATYYTARQDLRRCAYPLCGGIFVSAVNQDKTVCADGTVAEECYVADIQVSSILRLTGVEGRIREAIGIRRESTRAVLFGDLHTGARGFGSLALRFAWLALEPTDLRGSFYRVTHNGIVCVAAPCPSFDQEYLNTGAARTFHDVVLHEVPGAGRDDFESGPAMFSSLGLIVTGQNVLVEDAGPAGAGIFLQANQAFFPVLMPSAGRGTGVVVGGGSGPVISRGAGSGGANLNTQ